VREARRATCGSRAIQMGIPPPTWRPPRATGIEVSAAIEPARGGDQDRCCGLPMTVRVALTSGTDPAPPFAAPRALSPTLARQFAEPADPAPPE
jgi:hypothetical protein